MSGENTLLRFKGQTVPDEVVDECILNSNYIGLAVAAQKTKDSNQPLVVTIRKKFAGMEDSSKQVKAMLKTFPSSDMLVHFGTLLEGEKDADMQPFDVVFNTDKKPMLVSFMDNIEVPRDENDKWLAIKAADIFKLNNYDVSKAITTFEASARDFAAICQTPGSGVNLLFCNGQHRTMQNQEEIAGQDYEWGWVTNTYKGKPISNDLSPQPLTEEEELERIANGEELPVNQPPAPAPEPAKTEPAVKPGTPVNTLKEHPAVAARRKRAEAEALAANGKGAPPPDTGTEYEEFTPKKGMRQDDLLRLILKQMDGKKQIYPKAPENYWADYQADKLKIMRVKPVAQAAKAEPGDTSIGAAMKAASAAKTDTAIPKAAIKSVLAFTPVMSQETRKEVSEKLMTDPVVVDLIGLDNSKLMEPAALADYEGKYPDFAQQLGVKSFASFLHLEGPQYEKMVAIRGGEPLVKWAMWMRFELIRAMHAGYKLSKPIEEVTVEQKVHPAVAARRAKAGAA